jgi:hypothetical protein
MHRTSRSAKRHNDQALFTHAPVLFGFALLKKAE